MKIFILIQVFCLTMFLIVLLESRRELRRIRLTHYRIRTDKLPGNYHKKIVFFSDYHESEEGKNNNKILSLIHEENPDLVLVGGDMIRGGKENDNVSPSVDLLLKLSDNYPVLFGLGNHEEKSRKGWYRSVGNWEHLLEGVGTCSELPSECDQILSPGLYLADDRSVLLNQKLRISCLTLGAECYKRRDRSMIDVSYMVSKIGEYDEKHYQLLMAHDPYPFDTYREWGADLSLSGHIHGGLVKLPFLGPVISPRLFLFPKYSYGEYEVDHKKMIVTNGIGQHSFKVRLFNIPEIVSIDLSGKE